MMIRVPEESNFTVASDGSPDAWSVNPKLTSQRTSTSKSILKAIDFRETSPAASHKDMYIPIPGSSQVGGLAVGVPGELKGLWTAYEQYGSGRISWERLLQPSVKLSQGWRVSRELARRFRIFGGMSLNLLLRAGADDSLQLSWKKRPSGPRCSDREVPCSLRETGCNAQTIQAHWTLSLVTVSIRSMDTATIPGSRSRWWMPWPRRAVCLACRICRNTK